MQQKITNLSSILFYMLPYSFVIGPFLSEALIFISSLLIIYLIFKNKNYSTFFKNKLIIFLFIIYFLLILSSLSSDYILFSLKSSLFYFRWILLVISIHYLSIYNENFLKFFSINFLITFLIFFLDSHFQLIFQKNLIGYEVEVSHRISSFFKEELILGGFILKITPILFFCFFIFRKKLRNNRILFLGLIASIFSTIIISGERSAIVLFLLYCFLFFALNFKKFKQDIAFVLIIVTLFFGTIYFYSNTYKDRIFVSFFDSILNKVSHHEINRSKFKNFSIFSFVHEKHITSAYLMFRKGDLKSKLIGVGPKNFRNYCSIRKFCDYEDCCSSHPHNVPAQILAETGLVGFLFLISAYVYLILLIIKFVYPQKLNKIDDVDLKKLFLILGIFILVFPFSTSGSFFHNKFSILFFTLVGLLNAMNNKNNKIK